jgi:hypothetical protein
MKRLIVLKTVILTILAGCDRTPVMETTIVVIDRPVPSQIVKQDSQLKAKMAQQKEKSRIVRVGFGGPNLDACLSDGNVIGLNPIGDNFLSVRSSPSIYAREIDRLQTGDQVHMCETTDDGAWQGVVYQVGGNLAAECGASSPVSRIQPYSGRCKSGWVSSKYIKLFAG